MKISVIVPAHNEEENIANVIEAAQSAVCVPFELVVVNDHSTDKTAVVVSSLAKKYPNVRLAENTQAAGFANAIKTGFASALGEAVVPVMGDLCDDLTTINRMHDKLLEGYDVVCGSRYIKGGARLGGSRIKSFLSAFFGWSQYMLAGIPTHDVANAFKMYRKTVIDSLDIRSSGFEISIELPLKAMRRGFRVTEVPTVWKERTKGTSNFKMIKLFPAYSRLYLLSLFRRRV